MDLAQSAAVFFFFLVWHGFGTAIGLHRMMSHRALKAVKWLEYFLVLGGIMGFQGSPTWWVAIHRAHHKYSDQELDMHSPTHGFRWWNYSWFLKPTYPDHINPKTQCADLLKDPVYRFLEQDGDWVKAQWLNFFGVAVVARFLLLPILGWKLLAVSFLASVLFFQMPLFFNQVCHEAKNGYKNFQINDDSVNCWWVAILWFGEGWHNNHHAIPGSPKAGIRKHEIDISWIVIRLLAACRLVTIPVLPHKVVQAEARKNRAAQKQNDHVPVSIHRAAAVENEPVAAGKR